ncbi:MAG: TIGR03915 family putative DNA repair protein [Verrucomicrobiaceae bacterium]
MLSLTHPSSFTNWRTLTRQLLLAQIPPTELLWQSPDQASLFNETPELQKKTTQLPHVPKAFLDLARTTATHRSGTQWPHLYSLLWRLTHGENHLLSLPTDPDVHALRTLAKHISRDIHKMHAFVRFRKIGDTPEGREQFVAWFEPDHLIVPLATPFFRKRFAAMDWSILTPDQCVHWDGQNIHFTDGADKSQAPAADAQDDLWRTYYRSIFNPARLKVKAMQAEMPKKYWKNLPEADIIEELIATSATRTSAMIANKPTPEKPAPKNAYLKHLANQHPADHHKE